MHMYIVFHPEGWYYGTPPPFSLAHPPFNFKHYAKHSLTTPIKHYWASIMHHCCTPPPLIFLLGDTLYSTCCNTGTVYSGVCPCCSTMYMYMYGIIGKASRYTYIYLPIIAFPRVWTTCTCTCIYIYICFFHMYIRIVCMYTYSSWGSCGGVGLSMRLVN